RIISVGAIVLAAGFEEFDARPATQFGYKRFPNVVTSTELERLLSPNGPTLGDLKRPSDGQVPRSVAFLQCVGSRTSENDYCSSACCLYALKEAMMIKRKHPHTSVSFFYMDLRDFGKGYRRYYDKAASLGVEFVRCRVPRVGQDFRNHNLQLAVITDDGGMVTRDFDMVVLSVGQTPSPGFESLSQVLGLKLNRWGFCQTEGFAPVETGREGIYICGSASGPRDIADTVTGATAAAGQALALIAPGKPPAIEAELPVQDEPRIAIYVCDRGDEISRTVDIREILDFGRQLPGVVHAEEVDYLPQSEMLEEINRRAREAGANTIILAGGAVTDLPVADGEIPIETVNLRERVAWIHLYDGKPATEKAKKLIAMAAEKLRRREDYQPAKPVSVTQKIMVVGGGLAGLVAARALAERGFAVELVEISGTLGGHARHIRSLLDGSDVPSWLERLISEVEAQPSVHIRRETEVTEVAGYAGSFRVTLRQKGSDEQPVEAGAIILATGAEELQPVEYGYGESREVLTQRELEERLSAGEIKPAELKSVAMIQCVGSRDSQRPYCSRLCCSQALKNAINLKRQNLNMDVTIFYRDMMTYGLSEEYYTAAREQGIEFVRYEVDNKPEVTFDGGKLKIRAVEPVLGGEMVWQPDLLVLSPAIVPEDNARLADILGVERNEDGFFQEAEAKFRPVDFLKDGIYVCGLAHSPLNMTETIVQAQAAAQRAAQLLWRIQSFSPTMVSEVNERWCTGCELCIKVCPFEARYRDTERGIAQVIETLCRGCGACAAACPSGAAQLRELTDKQVISMLDAAL
ncbi:MAG: FAD-dependent oxidoreductase, partial [Chloroflexi bacterium]|nr:FAD-dependent oxidoreductase [Chloroflexota bacterium]